MKRASLQTRHVDSTLKQRGNGRFHVVSTWNSRGVFVGHMLLESVYLLCIIYIVMGRHYMKQ